MSFIFGYFFYRRSDTPRGDPPTFYLEGADHIPEAERRKRTRHLIYTSPTAETKEACSLLERRIRTAIKS